MRPPFKHLTTLTALALLCVPALGQEMADEVPAEALNYVYWAGADNLPGYSGSHMESIQKSGGDSAAMLAQIFNTISELAGKQGGRQGAQLEEAISHLKGVGSDIWKHPTALFVLPPSAGNENPTVVVLCKAGADSARVKADLDGLADYATEQGAEVPLTVRDLGNGEVAMILGSWDGKATRRLSDAPIFKRDMREVGHGKSTAILLWINVEGLLTLADQSIESNRKNAEKEGAIISSEMENWPKIKESLGLNGVKGMAMAAGFDKKNWTYASFVDAPTARRGVMALFDKPLDEETLAAIPASASFATAGELDLPGIYKIAMDTVGSADPKQRKELESQVAKAGEELGMDLPKFLESTGHTWAVYLDPTATGDSLLGLTLVSHLRDERTFDRGLAKLTAAINSQMKNMPGAQGGPHAHFSEVTQNGVTMQRLAFPFITPTLAVHDGKLIAGIAPQAVMAAAAKHDKKLTDSAEFKTIILSQLPSGAKLTGFSYHNLPVSAPSSYGNLLLLSNLATGMHDMLAEQAMLSYLPTLDKITPHLAPCGQASWSDATGLHSKGTSPFPGADLYGSGVALQVGPALVAVPMAVLLPALGAARRLARESNNRSNLIGNVKGVIIFSGSNKEYFPARNSNGQFLTTPIAPAVGVWGAAAQGQEVDGSDFTAASTGDYVMATLLNDGGIAPKTMLNPSESNAKITETAANGNVTLKTTADSSNYSYALLCYPNADLKPEWKDNSRSNTILFGDRVIGTPGTATSYSSVTTVRGRGIWKGALAYGDAHCETQMGTSVQGLKYGSHGGDCDDVFNESYGWDSQNNCWGGLLWHGCSQ